MLWRLTWKMPATPARRPIYQLRALARRTSGSGCGGWPTASARDWKDGRSNQHGKNARPLNEVAMLAGWANDAEKRGQPSADPRNGLANPGAMPSGSPAETGRPGQLNPAFALWLQGYSLQWMALAPSRESVRSAERATASSRNSQRSL
jgi:hypothetical protein